MTYNDEEQKNVTCKSCGENFVYWDNECEMREFGSYSQKIVKCPHCGRYIVVKTYEDRSLYVNYDARYYRY